ncbi:hypothetical protein [Bdellovibrio sp. HCB-110]|uniref:hypothetical protein n=1 Tax=Bdellovibrio sp. HCB-110 TaxID=3391182 RepID=UPI0039B53A53
MRLHLFFLILLAGSTCFAVNYSGPIGHREAFLANAGGGMAESPGNVLLNPAGLGFRQNKESSLTVSGNAISRQEFNVSQYAVDPEEMSIRPLLAAGIYPTNYGTMAIFISNPTSFKIYGGSSSSESGVNIKTLLRVDYEELAAGMTWAREIHPHFSWGVSAGIGVETQKSYGYALASQTGVTAVTSFSLTEQKTVSLFIVPGVLFKATDHWNVGLSMKALADLSSSATTMRFRTNSSSPTTVEELNNSYDPNGTSPLSFRLGQEFIFSANHDVYLDLIYQGASSSYNANNEKFLTDEIWSGALGYRNSFSNDVETLWGYSYARSGSADSNSLTAGVALERRNNEFIFGLYYLSSVPREADTGGFNSYGVMFSSNVEY